MEVWKPIKGYEKEFEVSNYGRVKGLERKVKTYYGYRIVKSKIRKLQNNGTGYKFLILRNGEFGKTIHRLVAEAFIPNPEDKKFVNHIDGNKHNNNVNNLEWVTRQENEDHAFRTGLKNSTGSSNTMAKLDETIVKEIRRYYFCNDVTFSEVAKKYNVHRYTISRIINRKTWKHI